MKFKEFLKNLFVNVKDGISRFFVAFVCSLAFFLTVSLVIIFDLENDKIIVPLCMSYGLVAVLSVMLKTAGEYISEKFTNIIQYILCGISFPACFILTHLNYDSLYSFMAYSGIVISMLCFIFFIIMRGENRDTSFPKIVSSFIFAEAICAVVSAGLSTCISAFQLLIFSWDDFEKIYLIVNLFVWIVGFVNIFLALMPKNNVLIIKSKIFRIFILFLLLPLYILLIGVLLLYLAKIVVTRHMPVGEINWFASFASLFFIFILMSVIQYTEKIAKLFVKFGGYFLIPVLIMQAIAVFERINAYGLTTPRTVSLVLIIISITFILGAIIIPKHLNKIAFSAGIIVLIVTITPLNVIDMPVLSQTNILKTTLEANGMLENGVVIPKENIDTKDAEKIISAFEYLKYNAKSVPEFIQDDDKSIKEIFGFSPIWETANDTRYLHFKTKNSVDISEYKTMQKLPDHVSYVIKSVYNNQIYEIDLKQISKALLESHDHSKDDLDIYIIDENTALYFNDFSFEVNSDNELIYCHIDGYILFKN